MDERRRLLLKPIVLTLPPRTLIAYMSRRHIIAEARIAAMSMAYTNLGKAWKEYREKVIGYFAEEDLDEAFEPFDMFT